MAEHVLNLIIDNDDNNFHTRFSEIVDKIRLKVRSPTHRGPLNPDQILNIEFTKNDENPARGEVGERAIVRAKMRLDNYYLTGFQIPNQQGGYTDGQQLYEFSDDAEGGVNTLPNSNLLPYTVRYPAKLVDRVMGFHSFVGAVTALGKKQVAQTNLITIALTISESVRFRWISEEFNTIFETGASYKFEAWMDEMIHQWKFLSAKARSYATDNDLNEDDLPIEPTPIDNLLMITHNFNLFLDTNTGPRLAAVCTMKLKAV